MDDIDELFSQEEKVTLDFNQAIRNKLILKLVEGDKIPEENSNKSLLLGLLDGSDRSTLSRIKLKNDKKAQQDNANAVRSVGDVLRSLNVKTYRPPATLEQRTIPEELCHRDFVPGELEITNDPLSTGQVMGNS